MPELFDGSVVLVKTEEGCHIRLDKTPETKQSPSHHGSLLTRHNRLLVQLDAEWSTENLPLLFQLIDDYGMLDFYIPTDDPVKLMESWPVYAWHACETGDCPHWLATDCEPLEARKHRDNVIIGVPCRTQAEADRLIPELLQLSGLCRGLWIDLREQTESIDFRKIPGFNRVGDAGLASALRKLFVTIGGIYQPIRSGCELCGISVKLRVFRCGLTAGATGCAKTSKYQLLIVVHESVCSTASNPTVCILV